MPDEPPSPEDLPPVRAALIADAPVPAEEAAPPPVEAAKPKPRSRTPYVLAGCAVLLLVGLVVVGVVAVVGAGGALAVAGAGVLAVAGSIGALFLFAGSSDPAMAPQDVPNDVPAVVVSGSTEEATPDAGSATASTGPATNALATNAPATNAVGVSASTTAVASTPAEDRAAPASEEDWVPDEEPVATSSAATTAPPAETKPRTGLKIVTGVTTDVRLGKDQPVGVEGEAAVVLVSAGARYPLPGSAPPGRYDIEATFPGESPLIVGKITVGLGGNAVVVCNTNMGICRPK